MISINTCDHRQGRSMWGVLVYQGFISADQMSISTELLLITYSWSWIQTSNQDDKPCTQSLFVSTTLPRAGPCWPSQAWDTFSAYFSRLRLRSLTRLVSSCCRFSSCRSLTIKKIKRSDEVPVLSVILILILWNYSGHTLWYLVSKVWFLSKADNWCFFFNLEKEQSSWSLSSFLDSNYYLVKLLWVPPCLYYFSFQPFSISAL